MILSISIAILFLIFVWQYVKRRQRHSIPPWISRGMSEDEWYECAEKLTEAGIFTRNPYPRPHKTPKKIESEYFWEPQDLLGNVKRAKELVDRPGNPYRSTFERIMQDPERKQSFDRKYNETTI